MYAMFLSSWKSSETRPAKSDFEMILAARFLNKLRIRGDEGISFFPITLGHSKDVHQEALIIWLHARPLKSATHDIHKADGSVTRATGPCPHLAIPDELPGNPPAHHEKESKHSNFMTLEVSFLQTRSHDLCLKLLRNASCIGSR
jgi:hypothetical protein